MPEKIPANSEQYTSTVIQEYTPGDFYYLAESYFLNFHNKTSDNILWAIASVIREIMREIKQNKIVTDEQIAQMQFSEQFQAILNHLLKTSHQEDLKFMLNEFVTQERGLVFSPNLTFLSSFFSELGLDKALRNELYQKTMKFIAAFALEHHIPLESNHNYIQGTLRTLRQIQFDIQEKIKTTIPNDSGET